MDVIEELVEVVKKGNRKKSLDFTQKALEQNVTPLDILEILAGAMKEVGEAFEKFEIFLPEMMAASNAMLDVLKFLEPKLLNKDMPLKKKAKIIMATVKGDVHEIGKNIVVTLLKANRFDVVDLGADVDSLDIIRAAEREGADLIGLSALMTTTMASQRDVIEILNEKKIRDKYKVCLLYTSPSPRD